MWRCVLLLVCLSFNRTALCYDTSALYGDNSHNISCTVRPELAVSKLRLEKYVSDENNLIRLNISVHWNNIPPDNESYPFNMEWFMTTKESGKRLLLLEKNFEIMSLGTLSNGIVKMSMTLLQDPVDCLGNVSAGTANETLFHSLLTLPINNKTSSEGDTEGFSDLEICNGYEEKPVCCKLSLLGKLNCEQHIRDSWVDFLYKVVAILLFLSVMYIPHVLPKSWYKMSDNVFVPGVRAEIENRKTQLHKLEHAIVIEVTDRKELEGYTRVIGSRKSDTIRAFGGIYEKLSFTDTENVLNSTYRLNVRLKGIIADSEQLLSEITTSSGLSQFFSGLALFFTQVCFTCKIRNEDCLRKVCHKTLCHTCYLFSCCGKTLKLLFSLVFWLPAILFYVYLEKVPYAEVYHDGIFTSFILFYTIGVVSLITFALVTCEMKGAKKFLVECLSNVLDLSIAKRAKNVKKLFLLPGKSYLDCDLKPCKIALFIFLLCFSIIYACVSFLPYLHLVFVLFWHGFEVIYSNYRNYLLESSYSENHSLLRVCVLIVCLPFAVIAVDLLLISSFFVLLYTTAFYLLCLIYVILGLIVNSSIVLPFITVLLLMCSYIYNTLQDTHKKMDNFKKALMKTLTEHNAILFKNAYKKSYRNQQNTVSFLKPKDTNEIVSASQNGKLLLVTNNLLLFHKIDTAEKIPYMLISDFFLHTMMKYPSRITPGSIYKLYIKNIRDICVMFVILSIMLFAILGFGQAHELTAGVQSLVTVGSGIVLFVFNNLLSRSRVNLVDDNGIHLKTIVKEVLNTYTESWEINNYDVVKIEKVSENIRADIIVQNGHNENVTFFVNSIPETDIYIHGITDSDDDTDGCPRICPAYHSSDDYDEL